MEHRILNCAVVRGSGDSTYLVLHGKKYAIAGDEVMEKLFVRPYYTRVTDKCLNVLPDGEFLSVSSRLVADSDNKVYLSVNGCLKLPILDSFTFDEMGFAADKIQVLPENELEQIPTGEPVEAGNWGWEHEDWMSCVPDDTLLSGISIPGTHDTMSYTCYHKNLIKEVIEQKKWGLILDATAACQAKSLEEQLKMGARFFDFRLDHTMRFYHGATDLKLVSEDAMQPLVRFLGEHPDETVLLRVKSENTQDESAYRNLLEKEVIGRYRQWFWSWSEEYSGAGIKDEHGVVIPVLGETRGKIVLFNSYQLEDMKDGVKEYIGYQLRFYTPVVEGESFPVTCQHLQDEYQLGSTPQKIQAIKENARKADRCEDSVYSINFLSGVDNIKLSDSIKIPVPIPQVCAMSNNPQVEKFLIEEIRNTTGIIVMDFMGLDEGVTPRVLFTNFRRH